MARINGFDRPFHPLQVVSWVLFGLFGVGFYMFFAPALPHLLWKLVATAVYTIVLTVVVWSTALATKANVVDPNVAKRGFPKPLPENDLTQDELNELQKNIDFETLNWCPYCQWSINKKSKHCRVCDRCVDIFDHHCKWLNNCIGIENYKIFLVSITSVEILLLIQLGTGVLIFAETYLEDDGFSTGFLPTMAFRFIIGAYLVILGLIAFSLGQLLLLHVSLVKRGLTTYEWIIQNREKAAKKKELKEYRQQQRQQNPDQGILARMCSCDKVQIAPQQSKAIVPGTIENSSTSSQSIVHSSDGSPGSRKKKYTQAMKHSSVEMQSPRHVNITPRGKSVVIKPQVTNTIPGYPEDIEDEKVGVDSFRRNEIISHSRRLGHDLDHEDNLDHGHSSSYDDTSQSLSTSFSDHHHHHHRHQNHTIHIIDVDEEPPDLPYLEEKSPLSDGEEDQPDLPHLEHSSRRRTPRRYRRTRRRSEDEHNHEEHEVYEQEHQTQHLDTGRTSNRNQRYPVAIDISPRQPFRQFGENEAPRQYEPPRQYSESEDN